MHKSDPPTSFGVFKPVDHIVMAFKNVIDLEQAERSLLEQGFVAADMVRYTPQEMIAQVEAEIPQASPLASIGQDLNLIKAHRALAQEDCSFLVVHAPKDDAAERVAQVARSRGAVSAQRYGSLIVEDLIEQPTESGQVFESPERGLDAAVVQDAGR